MRQIPVIATRISAMGVKLLQPCRRPKGSVRSLALLLLLAACAHRGARATLPVAPASSSDAIACADPVCWNRAVVWLGVHSYTGLQVSNGDRQETYGYAQQEASLYNASYAFLVTRTKEGRIWMDARGSLRCPAIRDELRGAFYHYLLTGEDVLVTKQTNWPYCVK
jgi:hypothetical protein